MIDVFVCCSGAANRCNVLRRAGLCIECGLLPEGTSLPSRADLCLEFGTSEKTVRRALSMLEEKGFIKTIQRKRPVVSLRKNEGHKTTLLALERIDRDITNDVLKAGVLLSYPLIKSGILHAVDSLGIAELNPLRDDMQTRSRYYEQLRELVEVIEAGGALESVHFDDMSGLYVLDGGGRPAFNVNPDSPVLLGRRQLEKLLPGGDVRYSAVYMNIVGLIAAGR